jgi:hypothetical protein
MWIALLAFVVCLVAAWACLAIDAFLESREQARTAPTAGALAAREADTEARVDEDRGR